VGRIVDEVVMERMRKGRRLPTIGGGGGGRRVGWAAVCSDARALPSPLSSDAVAAVDVGGKRRRGGGWLTRSLWSDCAKGVDSRR